MRILGLIKFDFSTEIISLFATKKACLAALNKLLF
jgi:hypothetical protein